MGFLNYLTIHRRWGIKRGDTVVDIGSGNNPIFRADILVDRYIVSDTERYSRIVIDRPMVNANGSRLPFKENSVDFVYCSHLLEHIPNPAALLSEIERIGRRGIIVTPYRDYEKLDPRKMHLWYIWCENNVLQIEQKDEWDEYPDISRYFYRITELAGFWKLYSKNYSLFNTEYSWEDEIHYNIVQKSEIDLSKFEMASQVHQCEVQSTVKAYSTKLRTKSLIGRLLRPFFA